MADKSEKITENAVSKAMAPSLASLKNIESGISKLNAQGNQGAEERIEGARAEKKAADESAKTNTLLEGVVKGIGDLNKTMLAGMKKKISAGMGMLLAGITAPIIVMVSFFKQLALEFAFLKKLTGGGLKKLFMPLKNLLTGEGKIAKAIKSSLKFIDKMNGGLFTKIGNFFKSFNKVKPFGPIKPTLFTKVGNFFKSISDFFKSMKKVPAIGPLQPGRMAKVMQTMKNFFGSIGRFFSKIMGMGKALVEGGKTASKIAGWAGKFGKLLGKLFLPITILMSAFDFVTGFMDGFKEDGIMGGLEGGLSKLLQGLIGMPLDLLKDGVSWILGKFGMDQAAETLDSFSFSDLIDKMVGGFFDMVDGVIGWLGDTFKFGSISEALTSMMKAIWMPLILFKEWILDPVVDWLGKIFNFDSTKFKEFDMFAGIQTLLEDFGDFFSGIFDIDIMSILKPMVLALPFGQTIWNKTLGGDDKPRPNMSQGADGVVRDQELDHEGDDKKIKAMKKKIAKERAKPDAGSTSRFSFTDERDDAEIKEMEAELAKLEEPYRKEQAAQIAASGDKKMSKKTATGGGTGGSAVKVSSKKVDLKGIDWDFISKKEGGSKTDGYVPNPEGSKSGVTIATGFDLGARNAEDLKGLPLSLKEKLSPYLGHQGMVASQYLESRPLTITKSEAGLIDKLSKGGAVKKLKAEWNKNAAIMKTPMFEDLTGAQQTVAASVAFQYGSLAKAPKFRAAAQEGRWDDVQGELRNFGDDYASRRTSEADYLMAKRPNNSGSTLNDLQMANVDAKSGGGNTPSMVNAPTTNNNVSNGTTVVQVESGGRNEKAIGYFATT